MASMNYRKLRKEMLMRSMRYANGVSTLYDAALKDIAREFALTEYDPDVVFSFENYGKFGRIDSIMSRLEQQIQQVVNAGVETEFAAAYKEHSDLLNQLLGNNIRSEVSRAFAPMMTSGNAAKVFQMENAANNITRSLRVWNGATLGQMETAVQEGLMEGMPAQQMAGLIEKYLNDPESCFRRFRIKTGVDADGKSMYGRKWKKRVRNENGSTSWYDADPRDYPVGQGVYHSSYRNALRYTRTTTNIAYRTADYERYQTEDFVIGLEIKTTGNPTHVEDICDMLQGKYPKDFKWTGWHPNCMCYQIPILASTEEINAMAEAIANGEDPSTVPVEGRITDVPDNFKEWVKNNEDRIDATIKDGKQLPYFLRDNGEIGDNGKWHIKKFATREAEASIVSIEPSIPDFTEMESFSQMKPYMKELVGWMDRVPVVNDDTMREYAHEALKNADMFRSRTILNGYYERYRNYNEELEESYRKLSEYLGIPQGKPMSFKAANELRSNPNYIAGSGSGYTINCQSTVFAYEMRRRGFDVEAILNTGRKDSLCFILSQDTRRGWIDPWTGNPVEYSIVKGEDVWTQLNNAVGEGRYHISWNWKNKDGHIVTMQRNRKGDLTFYDPQNGKRMSFAEFAGSSRYGRAIDLDNVGLHFYRVDNKIPNPDFFGVLAERGTTAQDVTQYSMMKSGWGTVMSETFSRPPLFSEYEKMTDFLYISHLAQSSELLENKRLATFLTSKLNSEAYILPHIHPTQKNANELRKLYLPSFVFENKNPDLLFNGRTLDIKSMLNTELKDRKHTARSIQKRLSDAFSQANDALIEVPGEYPLKWVEDAIKGKLKSCKNTHTVYLKYGNELFIY